MAATEEDVSALGERLEKLSVEDDEETTAKLGNDAENDGDDAKICESPRLWGFETRELYKLALNFYKGESWTLSRSRLRGFSTISGYANLSVSSCVTAQLKTFSR